MAGVPEADPQTPGYGRPVAIGRTAKQTHACGCIFLVVDRFNQRPVALGVAAVEMIYFRFLDMRGVRQHNGAKIDCCGSCVDRSAEALLDQLGQETAVIYMRVGQDDRVDRIRRKWECTVIQFPFGFRTLEQAAID